MKILEPIWERYYAKLLILSFWIIGLCNNFAYVLMLSAAHDILSDEKVENHTETNQTNKFDCNEISTGAVLLADIIPGIIIKLLAPFFVHRFKYSTRVGFVVITSGLSFLLVGLAPSNLKWITFIGVICASLSSSFGEITFLSLSTLYDRILAIAGWSSGTGAAGIGGSLSYAGLTSIGVSPRNSILIMFFIPILMTISYIVLPNHNTYKTICKDHENKSRNILSKEIEERNDRSDFYESINSQSSQNTEEKLFIGDSFKDRMMYKLLLIKPLLKYMIPLFVVYFAEYFINQGLFELLYFKNSFIPKHKDQYRWYNVCYQIAVFISRSSITLFKVKYLSLFPIFQLLNIVILTTQLFYGYMHSIWFILIIIFWEGLLGGGCYVNAFYQVSVDLPKDVREFSIAITSVADSFGITLAGFVAIPVHDAICQYGNK